MLSLDESLETQRVFTDTPEYQRGVQRYGIETINGNSRFAAVFVDRRDYSNARCKAAEYTSILRQIKFIR